MALLCLIQLGSTVAFNIIVSLSVLGLLSTYMISIGCVLLKRIRGEPLPPARWSLGRYGLAINAFAVLYSAFISKQSLGRTELRAAMPCLPVSSIENAQVAFFGAQGCLRHCKAAKLAVPHPRPDLHSC